MTYRLQLETANTVARRFAEATADEMMSDLRRTITNAEWTVEDMLDQGFDPHFLLDTVAGVIDGANDRLGVINGILDAERAPKRTLDLSDAWRLWERCRRLIPTATRPEPRKEATAAMEAA